MFFMRTTLDISDRALAAARAYASSEHCSLGQAVSQLILQTEQVATIPQGFPVFPGAPGHVITTEMVAEALNDD